MAAGQIACDRPNTLTAENYYKTHYKAPIATMELWPIRGFNYQNFDVAVPPNEINQRILRKDASGLYPGQTNNRIRFVPMAMNYAHLDNPNMHRL